MHTQLVKGYGILGIAGLCLLLATGAHAADSDGDGIDDAADLCPATDIPEFGVPSTGQLKKNRYALTGPAGNTTFESSNKTVLTTVDTGA